MVDARSLRGASREELRQHIVDGYPVDPDAIAGWVYRGTSLGLPPIAVKLTWQVFQKTFWRDPATGRLLGWNVRLEQDGIDSPSRAKLKYGRPVTTWHYEVVAPDGIPTPSGFDRGLIIDYARGRDNPRWDPIRLSKDPLVALRPDSADELLGVSYMVIAGRCVETPTYFTLVRERPISYVPY